MKKYLSLAVICFAGHQSVSAMSFQDAGLNLFYFEHAQLSTAHCEQRGFPVRPEYLSWYQKNTGVYRQAVEVIRLRAVSGGLSKADQDAVLQEMRQNQQKQASEQIAKGGVLCKRFDEMLTMYSTLLKR